MFCKKIHGKTIAPDVLSNQKADFGTGKTF